MICGGSTTDGQDSTRQWPYRLGLALVVGAYLVFAGLYALKVPKWNAPDEPAHFNYVKHLATTGTLPVLQPGDYDQDYLLQLTTARFPDSLPVDGLRYESHQPPLYYLLGAVVYKASEGASLDRQVMALRALSIFFGALLLLAVYALAGLTLPGRPLLALAATAFVGAVPMQQFLSAAVQNDSLSLLVMTLVLAVLVAGLRYGFADRLALVLGLLLGLALLTKVTIYGAVPLALLAILVRRRWQVRPDLASGGTTGGTLTFSVSRPAAGLGRQLALVGGPALLVSGWWFVRNALTYGWLDPLIQARHAAAVVGQPRTVYSWQGLEYLATTTFQSFWAQFGWMGILVDRRLYQALLLLTVIGTVGLAVWLWRLTSGRERSDRPARWSLSVLGLSFFVVLGEFLYYNLTFIQAQGRYLFPALGPIGIFFAGGLLALAPRRLAWAGAVALWLAFLVLDYLCLFRFVAPYFGTA